MSADGSPVLWHLKVSHYNEKARWALDYKGVPHVRRAAVPGSHEKLAKRLTGGQTLPILEIDGRAIGDSTRIIEELERRHPDPPLYPRDPEQRERALALEDYFDEELGPHTRLLLMHHALPEAKLFLGTFIPDGKGPRLVAARAAFPAIRARINKQFGIDERSVALAFDKLDAAGERFQKEIGASGYLVGDTFTVADLTLAALLAPPLAPEQFPYPQPQRAHERLARVRERADASGLLDWMREIYARHRGTSAEIRPA